MATDAEIEERFWKQLKSDRTMMLGLDGARDGHTQPMTAQFEHEGGPIYFFCASDNSILGSMGESHRAIATFADKGHDLFASVHGSLGLETDEAVIDRLWNPFVAAWFEGGRDDPKLRLLRLDGERAQIWLNESSLFAGIKTLLGRDPKKDYEGKVAEVTL